MFYGNKFPLFIHAFKRVLFPPSTATLSIFYFFYWRAQPLMTTMSQQPQPQPPKKPLLDQMRDALRARHYSIRTETSYLDWAKRFILFHNKRHPESMGASETMS